MKQALFTLKERAKQARWRVRRRTVARRYGAERLAAMPAVLGNAIPKSGSHLIFQVLSSLPRLGAFVAPGFPPVNRWEDNRKLPTPAVLANITRMRSGDIGYGYLHCKEPFLSALTAPGRATIFVYRDPRDVVVSAVKYGAYINPNHPLHAYYHGHLETDGQRFNAVIQGIEEPGFEYSSIRTRYQHYLGWLQQPDVLCLRFEDLVGAQTETFGRILDYLATRGFDNQPPRDEALAILAEGLDPSRSGTFRKGQPGAWRDNFTDENKTTFKQVAGDILVDLGYESDNDW